MEKTEPSLKIKTARTLKWNTIDKLGSQVIYAVVGVVLANILSKEDFGLVGALLIFQAFAIIFVDSGFGAALLQKKDPDEDDYSTVFWFNTIISILIYILLFFCAPLIAGLFHNDRLIPLSKVMFITFVINGLAIVQTNRLMKKMDVRMVAMSNIAGLIISGGIGLWLAIENYGPWAIVWQSVSLAAVKTGWLWITGKWIPKLRFSLISLKGIWRVGLGVFSSSMLNTICLNIYNFVIGAFYNLVSLGVYTQADKWSKMGSASISQILTASFVPLLSRVQDNRGEFIRYMKKVDRFTAFIVFPTLIGLAVVGEPLFHTLFGNKWDDAILLFQILAVRGIFVVLISLYGNFLLSLGYARTMFRVEIIKDVLIIGAILATVFYGSVTLLVWGQLAASVITYLIVLFITSRSTGYSWNSMVGDLLPFAGIAIAASATAIIPALLIGNSFLRLATEILIGVSSYLWLTKATGMPETHEALSYLLGRLRK